MFNKLFSIDLRSLAIFRILIALLIIIDLFIRALDIKTFYSDEGVLPRQLLIDKFANYWSLSIHLLNGSPQVQAALFLVAVFFAFLLLIGYKTKLATIVSWFFLISIQVRNPTLYYSGDVVLRLMIFWSIFLPLGAYYSVDNLLSSENKKPPVRFLSFSTAAILLQVAFIYFFSALLKSPGKEWFPEGSAVYYALNIDQYASYPGLILRDLPDKVLRYLTYSVFWFELIGPILLFLPIFTLPVRLIAVIGFLLMQAGFGFFMTLELFPWVCSVAMVPFLPGEIFERIIKLKLIEGFKYKISNFVFKNLPKTATGDALKFESSSLSNLLSAFFLIYALVLNVSSIYPNIRIPNKLKWIGPMTGIEQRWGMFAPYPYKSDGWYVIPGTLRDGTVVDVFKNREGVIWEKPKIISSMYKTVRWRAYMMNLWYKYKDSLMLYYGKYLCISWNKSHKKDKQLLRFSIYFMKEDTLGVGQISKPEKKLLWEHFCFCDPKIDPKGCK